MSAEQLAETEPQEVRPDRPPRGGRSRSLPETAALIFVLVAMIVLFSVRSPFFLGWENFLNILVNSAIIGILAAPSTILLVAGQVDLSVGSGAAFIGILVAVTAPEIGIPLAILLAVGAGLAIGLVNGFSVSYIGINSIITTLGTLAIFRGLAKVFSDGQTVRMPDFSALGTARPFLSIPVPVLIFLAVMAVVAVILRSTTFGRRMFAIGSNPAAARLVGIRSRRYILGGFLVSGLSIALAGLILLSQLGAASPNAALGMELSVITAVVLGGASLSGGRGTVMGTLLGVLILGVLNNGLILLQVDTFWQEVARGTLLLLAVGFEQLRQGLLGPKETKT